MKKGSWDIKNNRTLALIAFLNGAVIMSVEIVGARTIAPYFGTSTYVWTAVIGVILGALALGYWQGGIVADKGASFKGLQKIFLIATAILAVTTVLQAPLLNFVAENVPSLRLQSALASMLLFAPMAFFLGMVSPYIAKLALRKLSMGGEIIGKLYALGTFGSIAGTFITGYFLINILGNRQLYWIFVGILVLLSILANRPKLTDKKLMKSLILLFVLVVGLFVSSLNEAKAIGTVYAKDTAYASYRVSDIIYRGKQTRLLVTDNSSAQSGVLINEPLTPAFSYTQALIQVTQNLKPKNILMIGGGAYTLPTIITTQMPNANFDVVEIDPKLDDIAKDYFGFKQSSSVKIIHEDGRTYLNRNSTKYDLIIIDAYSSIRPPFHLTTAEAVEKMKSSLNPGGIIASNVIGSLSSDRAEFIASVQSTMKQSFKSAELFYTSRANDSQTQNILLIASDDYDSIKKSMQKFKPANTQATGIILTDNFAPTEKLLGDF